MRIISVVGVRKRYARSLVLDNIDLEIGPSTFLSILGGSGCGKSTLLRLMAGFEAPSEGMITRSEKISEPGKIGFVFQSPNLLPWKNVLGNIELPLKIMGIKQKKYEEIVRHVIDITSLSGQEKKYPHQLSGGMQMRVSIARALVTRPMVLFMDEPFAALDEKTRKDLNFTLRDIFNTMGITVIFVTHNIAEAVYLSDRISILGGSPASIVETIEVARKEIFCPSGSVSQDFGSVVEHISKKFFKRDEMLLGF